MLLLGIIGHPLSHTLSPTLHNWGFSELGIAASYHVWDTPPDRLAAFMAAMRTLPIHGASVTIPHKETVMNFTDGLTRNARDIGAVNTLFWEDGRLLGDNTDVTGFMEPLREYGAGPGKALVLGAGGAARAAACGLHRLGWEVLVSSRTENRAERLAGSFHAKNVAWSERHDVRPDLLVNTTPLGYDLIYNPRQTPLLAQAEREGVATLPGLPMFVHQALAQFERWTGRRFPLPGAVSLLEDVLAGRGKA
jgi:shikimate dehydrogenase